MEKRIKYVYLIKEKDTHNVVYVGETYNVKRRFWQHMSNGFPKSGYYPEAVAEFEDRKDAISLEAELKRKYNLPTTETDRAGHWNKPKPMVVHTISGDYVGDYYSVQDAVRRLDLIKCDVYHCLAGRTKQHKGYTFQYKPLI
jgi:predicted GIY-YIG superfamily endonuclease